MTEIDRLKLLSELGIDSGEHIWEIEILRSKVTALAINDSLRLVRINKDVPVPITQDDANTIAPYYEAAIGNLTSVLARYCEPALGGGVDYTNDKVVYRLVVGDNHDDNRLIPLRSVCNRYLADCILEGFYATQGGSEKSLNAIRSHLHARKRSAARKVRPIL